MCVSVYYEYNWVYLFFSFILVFLYTVMCAFKTQSIEAVGIYSDTRRGVAVRKLDRKTPNGAARRPGSNHGTLDGDILVSSSLEKSASEEWASETC